MATNIQDITSELSDNWPAFLYITVMTGFSIRFLIERRTETRILKQMAEQLHETVHSRFDRLEYLIRHSNPGEPDMESPGHADNRLLTITRRR